MVRLSDTISTLHHIGRKTEPKLNRLELYTVGDLLWHLPTRYEDLSQVIPVNAVESGQMVTVKGRVQSLSSRRSFRRRMTITELRLTDGTGTASAVWFNQAYIAKMLKAGDEMYLSGTAQKNLTGIQFTNPVYEKVRERQLHTAQIVPYYTLTAGVTHKQLRFLIDTALEQAEDIVDELPAEVIDGEKLPALHTALRTVHFPDNPEQLEAGKKRLKFEELFWAQLRVGYARKAYEKKRALRIGWSEQEAQRFVASLPFILTDDQRRAAWETLNNIRTTKPMNRLIQGDVGSGKTVVAALPILMTIRAGYQAALMAPTEILAVQHHATLQSLLPDLIIALLTSKNASLGSEATARAVVLKKLAAGAIDLLIGTHSLIQEGVRFKKLGLVVVDEQHRFGVGQRQRLTTLSPLKQAPHLLSLTATPIPRSLALTLYGDLDISTIRQKPLGRKPIMTRVVPERKRKDAYAFFRKKIGEGQQIFILYPLIDAGDDSERKAVLQEYERLQREIFPDLKLRYLHGRLKASEKKEILEDFKKNRFPILVTTSVIEVGIDIPNATIMVIEGAERFGLAQLHQFRGRVGRNDLQSYCLLFTNNTSEKTLHRLRLLVKYDDGFLLAEEDLKTRGEGNVFGTQQSGIVQFKVATLHDIDLIKKSRAWVDRIIERDADLSFYKQVKTKLSENDIHWE
ncbi:MAG: ATP-dependent DNA helicase RecG [Patescibacteria group bacterium]